MQYKETPKGCSRFENDQELMARIEKDNKKLAKSKIFGVDKDGPIGENPKKPSSGYGINKSLYSEDKKEKDD